MQTNPQQPVNSSWNFYVIADLLTWATNTNVCPIEHFTDWEAAKARFMELRGESYNSEKPALNPGGKPYSKLALGLERADGLNAVDILHVRHGKNYLVDDFTRLENLRSDPAVLSILSRVAREIGFDRVHPYVQTGNGYRRGPDLPFSQWENPYFDI